MSAGMAMLLRALLRIYQLLVSPLLGPACRFEPSCSEYARQAIDRHGAGQGSLLALRRLLRCHPLGGSGFDPVPEERGSARLGRALGHPTRSDA
jgi:hypothetical protein